MSSEIVPFGKYEDHPLAAIFPLLAEEELAELAVDIKENGLKQAIVLYEHKILDGRNRYRACLSVNVKPRFEQYAGQAPLADIISWNAKRRHLSKTQVAAILLDALPLLEKEKKRIRLANLKQNTEGEFSAPSVPKGKSSDVLGVQAGLSGRLIRQVKAVKDHDPERFEQLRLGKMPLTEARRLTQREQRIAQYEKLETEALKRNPEAFSEQRIVGWINGLPIITGGPNIRPGWSVWGDEFGPEYIKKHGITGVPEPPPPPPLTPDEIEDGNRQHVITNFEQYIRNTKRLMEIPPETIRQWIAEYLSVKFENKTSRPSVTTPAGASHTAVRKPKRGSEPEK